MDETAALRDLDDRLRGVPQPTARGWPSASGGSGWPTSRVPSRGRARRLGRGLTEGELEGVIRRFR